jgi:hypothetical protein
MPVGDRLRWARMELEFSGQIWYWKGPAPWYFVTVPAEECRELAEMSAAVSYGWGMIPVSARIGKTGWKTSLWPKDGGYIVPVKASVRTAERLAEGDLVTVRLTVDI